MKFKHLMSKRAAYVTLFGILYLAVAFTSMLHAIQFFGLTNENYLSVILAIAFEIGQSAVLFALLTTKSERGKITPWVLMCIFTLVQIIGNVYSSYKYAVLNSIDNLRFFKEPIFIWTTNISDDMANVIVTYISSSILPIAALLLTSMVANYLSDTSDTDLDKPVGETLLDSEEKVNEDIDKINAEMNGKEYQQPAFDASKINRNETAKTLDKEINKKSYNPIITNDEPILTSTYNTKDYTLVEPQTSYDDKVIINSPVYENAYNLTETLNKNEMSYLDSYNAVEGGKNDNSYNLTYINKSPVEEGLDTNTSNLDNIQTNNRKSGFLNL